MLNFTVAELRHRNFNQRFAAGGFIKFDLHYINRLHSSAVSRKKTIDSLRRTQVFADSLMGTVIVAIHAMKMDFVDRFEDRMIMDVHTFCAR